MSSTRRIAMAVLLLAALTPAGVRAAGRDASFMDPNLTSNKPGTAAPDAVTVEPKSDIDTGESIINVARRTTLFFVNQTNLPVNVVSVTATGDGNVKSDLVGDDCSKQTKIEPSSRCSVTVEVTSASPGAWTVEVQLTHDGPGRIARAKLSGKTSGQAAEKKDNGLSLSTKDIKPVDFGEVDAAGGMAVRSALMLNDSPDPISILSIDVIAAENGLERLDQGCAVDEELKPGESCPVTMVWKPQTAGQVSTDLIIRHTGRTGFSVIPLRGAAKGEEPSKNTKPGDAVAAAKPGVKSASPTAEDIEKVAAKLPPLPADLLPSAGTAPPPAVSTASADFHLIGTVGNRAVLLKPDGETAVADVGEEIAYGATEPAKLTNVTPKGAEIFIGGKKKQLLLEAASQLTAKARASVGTKSADTSKPSSPALQPMPDKR